MIYIKINKDNSVSLAGTILTKVMENDGYLGYAKEIPNSNYLKWDNATASIVIDDVKVAAHLESYKKKTIERCRSELNDAIRAITDAPPHEMVSWRKQEEEARAFVADSLSPTPFLDVQIVSRGFGETVADLAAKIIANAEAYELYYANELGAFQRKVKQIENATSEEEVDAVSGNNTIGEVI